jgi:hypothetical protein
MIVVRSSNLRIRTWMGSLYIPNLVRSEDTDSPHSRMSQLSKKANTSLVRSPSRPKAYFLHQLVTIGSIEGSVSDCEVNHHPTLAARVIQLSDPWKSRKLTGAASSRNFILAGSLPKRFWQIYACGTLGRILVKP